MKNERFSVALLCSAGMLALAAGAPALAQEARVDVADTTSDASTTGLGDIIVTAQRRSERLLDVPVSVSVVDAERAATSGAITTRNLGEIASGLTSTTNGIAFQPAIRGITTTGTSAGDESNVALYVDGVYMASQTGNFFNLRNIERIEVLKGPQGTLFGRNATGGAIRIVTADPSLSAPQVSVDASYGTRMNSIDLNGYASMPLGEQFALGVTASYFHDDGYVKNINPGWSHGKLGRTETESVRGKLLWAPNEQVKLVLSGDYARSDTDTQFVLSPVDGISAYRNTPGVLLPRKPRETSINIIPSLESKQRGVSLSGTFELDNFTIGSITSYRHQDYDGMLDGDRTNLPLFNSRVAAYFKWFTQEVTVATNFDGPLNAIGGVFFFKSDSASTTTVVLSNPVLDSGGFAIDPGTPGVNTPGKVKSDSIAGFGEATWNITDRFSIVGGLRYTTEKKRLRTIREGSALPDLTDSKRWSNWNYRATAQYRFTDDTNIYFTHSTGFKAGAYQATSRTFVQRADPEKVTAYELGLKSRPASWLSATLAAYHYKYDRIQVQSNNFTPSGNAVILANAAKATITGIDGDLAVRPAEGLTVQFGGSWLPKADYDEYRDALVSVPKGYPGSLDPSLCPASPLCGAGNDQIIRTLHDSRMIRAPEWSGNVGASYEAPLGGGTVKLNGNLFFSSGFYWVAGEHIEQKSYQLVNARAAWTDPTGHYTVAVFGRNLTSKAYGIYASPNASGTTAAWAAPREIGVTLGVSF